MTVKSSGSLAFSEIQTEFTGSNPISLSEYYAGGSYVTAGTTGINGAIPSSGAISVSKFYGTQKTLAILELTAGLYSYNFVGDPINQYQYNAVGYTTGYSIGTCSPGTIQGQTIYELYQINDIIDFQDKFIFTFGSGPYSQSYFTTIQIYVGASLIKTYNSSEATLNVYGNSWTWDIAYGSGPFTSGDSYTVIIK